MTNLDSPLAKQRINSIDIVRGLVMLVMALDHTRDNFFYLGPLVNATNMATTTPFLFFTRWITHFCAPTFVFLSGVSAFIAGTRRTKPELMGFLIKRGLWIVVVEILIIAPPMTMDPLYNVIIFQVMWAIGCSMIILGLLVKLPLKVIGTIGAIIFFGHNIVDYITAPKPGAAHNIFEMLFATNGEFMPLDETHGVFDLYAVIPWAGVMMMGYTFGSLYNKDYDAGKRRKLLRFAGFGSVIFFIVLRLINQYGDPAPWSTQRNGLYTFMSFLNVTKYPPSLLYSTMTIGTSLVLLSYTEKVKNKFTDILMVYGNVPFFYYVMHFYVLAIIHVIVFYLQGFNSSQIFDPKARHMFYPHGYGFQLGTVYIIWLCVITALYFPCRWYRNYKRSHTQWWLSYL